MKCCWSSFCTLTQLLLPSSQALSVPATSPTQSVQLPTCAGGWGARSHVISALHPARRLAPAPHGDAAAGCAAISGVRGQRLQQWLAPPLAAAHLGLEGQLGQGLGWELGPQQGQASGERGGCGRGWTSQLWMRASCMPGLRCLPGYAACCRAQ
jgi:hypothetical protein